MRSPRSLGFLRPANTIFVPGMYFLGFSRYSKRVSFPHVIPAKKGITRAEQRNCPETYLSLCWRRCKRSRQPGQFSCQKVRADLARFCVCHRLQRCDIERTSAQRFSCPFLRLQQVHPWPVSVKLKQICLFYLHHVFNSFVRNTECMVGLCNANH